MNIEEQNTRNRTRTRNGNGRPQKKERRRCPVVVAIISPDNRVVNEANLEFSIHSERMKAIKMISWAVTHNHRVEIDPEQSIVSS